MGYREMTREECMIFLRQVKHVLLRSKSWLDNTHKPIQQAFDMAIEALEGQRTGYWIPCTKEGLYLSDMMRREGKRWYGYKCSECGFIYKGNALTESPVCQSCGRKMEVEHG